MSKQRKTILIIEDQTDQREIVIKTLNQYKFKAFGADSISGSLELLENHKNDGVVIVLDMNLTLFPDYDDNKEGAITGIGLAKKVLQETSGRRPEIVILSAFANRVEYYKQAIETGASAYLIKSEDYQKVVPTVQALALKHSFRADSFNDAEISGLAEGHASSFEVLEFFIHNKLVPELELCLTRDSFVLLVRDASEAQRSLERVFVSVHSNLSGIPEQEKFDYSKLHQKIFTQVSPYRSYEPEAGVFQGMGNLQEMVFIQLANTLEVEIALGIPKPFPVKDKYGSYEFPTKILAESLIQHVSPALELFVQKLRFVWQEKQRAKLERLQTNVALSAALHRRLTDLLARKASTVKQEEVDNLTALVQELSEYNRTLSTLLDNTESETRSKTARFRLSDIVREISAEYDLLGNLDDPLFHVESDCQVPAERYFFTLALRELIRWTMGRKTNLIAGEKQLIQLGCVRQGNWLEISFIENSARIPEAVRAAYLFESMSPLQIAQMVLEVACQGKLIDATCDSPLQQGQFFKIKLLHN